MEKPSRHSIDYYILPNKILCSIAGMWPSDEKRSVCSQIFVLFRLVLSLTAASFLLVPQIILIAMNWGDLKILTGVGCVSVTIAQFFFKIIYAITRREKSYKLYKELRSLWDSTDDPKEREHYEELAYWARICTIAFPVSAAITTCAFVCSAVYDNTKLEHDSDGDSSRQLPMDASFILDITESPIFEIVFVVQALAICSCIAPICGVDTWCVTLILHVSGQFRLICAWITNIGIEIRCGSTNYITDCPTNVAAKLIRCIRHHQRLIHVVHDVNNLLAPIIFVQLFTSGIELCLTGFAIINDSSTSNLIRFSSYLSSMMIQLLIWCLPGEVLVQESQEVGHAIYLYVPWYKLPPIYRRQLLLMILRSQKYCCISTFTIQTLSIHTLTDVFNAAASYIALLRQMQEKTALKS